MTEEVCSDVDFQAAISMINILAKHSSHVFSKLPEDVTPTKSENKKDKFREKLPLKFTGKEFVDLAKSLSITEKTVYVNITTFCEKGFVVKVQKNGYTKVENKLM